MKSNVLDVVEDVTIVAGVTISLSNLYTILGIILLAFQIGLIIFRVVRAIIKHYKAKDLDAIVNDIESGANDIKDVIDKHDGKSTK